MAEEEMTDTEKSEQPGRLSIVATTADGIRVLTPAGEIDHHTGDALRQALDFSATAEPRIVVDLQQVTFMDSSGINLLIAAHSARGEAGGWLRLAGAPAPVLRVLEMVGLNTFIDCHTSLEEALTA
ncbi:STAS domain-containing protein [Streptomyces sp. NPDC059688]|uniref:STAS domain-containing protein n=1 Tax=Streptomyces sp. NPDC059688 TaxID=3346906 RepID=UPI003699388B